MTRRQQYLNDIQEVAKAYCERINAKLIYANEYEIGMELASGALCHKTWNEIANILSKMEEK